MGLGVGHHGENFQALGFSGLFLLGEIGIVYPRERLIVRRDLVRCPSEDIAGEGEEAHAVIHLYLRIAVFAVLSGLRALEVKMQAGAGG